MTRGDVGPAHPEVAAQCLVVVRPPVSTFPFDDLKVDGSFLCQLKDYGVDRNCESQRAAFDRFDKNRNRTCRRKDG
jgi:hypothetical protein